jgi:16S rRNA (adenine1518-N6/adenine1519-N6)-dimethyltransferase
VRARKRFGQHFLEPAWVKKVVDLIAPEPGQRFLEIGPGRGVLTLALAERGAEVFAIEIDRDLASELEPRLPPTVVLRVADVLQVDLAAWLAEQGVTPARPVRVAANLPYNIASPVLVRLVETWRRSAVLADATLMVQLEVADRLLAGPGTGDYGPLAIVTRAFADGRLLLRLPPGAFRPPPKVHSAVVGLTFRQPAVQIDDYAWFERMVRGIFMQRRKTLANALRPVLGGDAERATRALRAAGLEPRRRPETLALEELALLARVLGGEDAPEGTAML